MNLLIILNYLTLMNALKYKQSQKVWYEKFEKLASYQQNYIKYYKN